MARLKISQADARWFRKRAEEAEAILRNQRNRWASEFRPGWVNIASVTVDEATFAEISTARLLAHAVLVTTDNRNEIRFYADKL